MQSAGSPDLSIAPIHAQVGAWQGQWLGKIGLFTLLGFTWLPDSYNLMVSWPYCLWWQGAFLLLVAWSLWITRQFPTPLQWLGFNLDKIALFILVGMGLSTLTAQFKPIAVTNFLLFSAYGIVLYLLVNWGRQTYQLKTHLWLSLTLVGTLTHLISLALWRPTVEMWTSQNFYAAIRNPFPLGHHNFVGGYCLLMLPIVIGYTLTQMHKRRWLGYGAILINAIALYASGSRGALIGALLTGFLAILFYFTHHPSKKIKCSIACGLLCLCLMGALVTNPRIRSLPVFNFSATDAIFSIEQIADSPTKDRLFMLIAGQRIFTTHPLLGIGPGNLSRVYNLYRPLETGNGLDLVQQLHNTPVQILAELGVVGFLGYLLWLSALLKISITLHRKKLEKTDRILLYSIGCSWFAYSISSLTDYQLENIGIASTLVVTTSLLISLADRYVEKPRPAILTRKWRRLLSLFLLLYFSCLLQFWARIDASFYVAASAQKDYRSHKLVDANTKWLKASSLVPWDPTYAALSADQFIRIRNNTDDAENQNTLTTAAIASFTAALKAAPNDPLFNQNLGVLFLQSDLTQAEKYLRRTVQLSPRNQYHTYFTLGYIYLRQQDLARAKTAFVLEAISNPKFLVDPIWETPSFSALLPDVVTQTLTTWQQILTKTSIGSPHYAWLNQQIALIQWWYHWPLSTDSSESFSTTIQSILQIESNPSKALTLLNQAIESTTLEKRNKEKSSRQYLLLRAWLAPAQYLDSFSATWDSASAESQVLRNSVYAYRTFRDWLMSVQEPVPTQLRYGLAFAYRNKFANNISSLLFADGLSSSKFLTQLTLFPAPPREFPQLDRTISRIGSQALSFSFPSQNRFKLSE